MGDLNVWFLVAGAMNMAAAILHIAVIVNGAGWYRKFGAGERLAEMARQGHWWPATLTSMISFGLMIFAFYAWAGAGLLPPLPFEKLVLWVITSIYLLRGIGVFVVMPFVDGVRTPFMLVSSLIVIIYGVVHLAGLIQMGGDLPLPQVN